MKGTRRMLVWPSAVMTGLFSCISSELPSGLQAIDDSGTYELVHVNGQAVPVDHGPSPPRFGSDSTCHYLTDQGALSLDRESGRYMRHTIRRSSCGGHILSNLWTTGSYAIDGEILRLDLSSEAQLAGTIREDTVEIDNSAAYVYARRLGQEPSPRSLSGTYQLTGVGGNPLPVDLGPLGTPGGAPACTTVVTEGTLSIGGQLDANTQFQLRYSLRDSCTDELLHEVVEPGTMERVDRSLAFTAQLDVSLVKLYPGMIRGEDLVIFREQEYTFRR